MSCINLNTQDNSALSQPLLLARRQTLGFHLWEATPLVCMAYCRLALLTTHNRGLLQLLQRHRGMCRCSLGTEFRVSRVVLRKVCMYPNGSSCSVQANRLGVPVSIC